MAIPDALVPLLGSLYSPFYFTTILCTAFYGASCTQTFFYYIHYQNDPLYLKSYVAVVWALNTVHEALIISGAFKYIMAGLVNPSSLLDANLDLVLLFLYLTDITTHIFFVYRIYVFSGKSIVVPLFFGILEMVQLVTGCLYIGKAFHSENGAQGLQLSVLSDKSFTTLATLCLSFAGAIDVLIAISLTFLLLRSKTSIGFKSTAHILQRLAVFAVSTAILPAIFALLTIILLHLMPSSMLYAVFDISLGSVYCNTLLANLNARAYIRGEDTTDLVNTDMLASSCSPEHSKGDKKPEKGTPMVSSAHQGVWMTTEVVTFPDEAKVQNV